MVKNARDELVKRAREAHQRVGTLGGADEIVSRARRAMAHFQAIDSGKQRTTAQLIEKIWDQSQVAFERARKILEHLPAAYREAGATLLVANHGEEAIFSAKFELFLTELGQNLNLFNESSDPLDAFERAVLVSAPSLPPDSAKVDTTRYQPINVAAVRKFESDQIEELESEYGLGSNPVIIWEAIGIAASAQTPFPEWIQRYLEQCARGMSEISALVASGEPIGKEADQVGKALGFGTTGKGRGSHFGKRSLAQRDRVLYAAVRDQRNHRTKLESTYTDVADAHAVSAATVRRAYKSIVTLVGSSATS